VWYTGQFYALFYMITVLKIPLVTVYIVLMVALTVGSIFFIYFGWLFDHIGRRNIMTLGFALAVVTYWPVFTWLGTFKDNPVMLTVLVFYLVLLYDGLRSDAAFLAPPLVPDQP
jgi:MFS family permease